MRAPLLPSTAWATPPLWSWTSPAMSLYVDSAAISLGNYLYITDAVKASGLGQ